MEFYCVWMQGLTVSVLGEVDIRSKNVYTQEHKKQF